MTEGPWAELGTALHAQRLELLRIAGRLAQRAAVMAEANAGPTVDSWADETASDARDLAAGVESITRRADSLLDDTAVMDLADVAETCDDE